MIEENGHKDVASEPTNEQLANFACVIIESRGFGIMNKNIVKSMLDVDAELRKLWLEHHTNFQRDLDERVANTEET